MGDINISKCPSCGAANMQEADENRINCIQCGANLSLVVNKTNGFKKWLTTLLVVVLITSAVFYYITNKTEELLKEVTGEPKPIITQPMTLNKPISAIPKLKNNSMTITSEQFKQSQDAQIVTELKIVGSSEGTNKTGGRFWLVTIENQTSKTISRPRVSLMFLNEKNKKIQNYTAWAKREQLLAGKTAHVLIDIPQLPKEQFHVQITAQSSEASGLVNSQQLLQIKDFNVTILDQTHNSYELSGIVHNPHNYQVDFAEVIAIAKNKQSQAIGYAKAYAKSTTIAAKSDALFTLKAEKYITQAPYSWTLIAVSKK